jgi:hypothetical protein
MTNQQKDYDSVITYLLMSASNSIDLKTGRFDFAKFEGDCQRILKDSEPSSNPCQLGTPKMEATSVTLSPATAGRTITLKNNSEQPINVYGIGKTVTLKYGESCDNIKNRYQMEIKNQHIDIDVGDSIDPQEEIYLEFGKIYQFRLGTSKIYTGELIHCNDEKCCFYDGNDYLITARDRIIGKHAPAPKDLKVEFWINRNMSSFSDMIKAIKPFAHKEMNLIIKHV